MKEILVASPYKKDYDQFNASKLVETVWKCLFYESEERKEFGLGELDLSEQSLTLTQKNKIKLWGEKCR